MTLDVGFLHRRLVPIVLLAAVALLPAVQTAEASPASSPEGRSTVFADNDGDGIQDDFDPDDDNDGITDDQDSQPSVPGSATDDGPDILDPGQDSDGDGISNAHDPDDNNNGVTDETDPSSFPPSNPGQPTSPGSGNNGGSNPGQQSLGGSDSSSLIRSLPVTGSGEDVSRSLGGLLSVVALLLAIFTITTSRLQVTTRER